MSIRKKYNIPQNGKVLLYVGNISENKNQRQMVEAFDYLPEELRCNTWVLFCGRPSVDHSFEAMLQDSPYHAHLIMCGAVEKQEMPSYYREANGVVLLSISEGFGLSLIEGMHFGVPCAMFQDMDSFEDIYDENAVISLAERSNECVAEGITQLLTVKWNHTFIKTYSQRFDNEAMGRNYIKAYQL